MNSLVNTIFCRTYNPSGRPNALSDIKRLLTSRDTVAQSKACGYLMEVVSRYSQTSSERIRMVEYLLDNDITVFLCEATSTLDLSLFRSILSCFRLLWRERRYFSEEHAAYSMTAVLRALAHFTNSSSHGAVKCCLHFLCDLLTGISAHETAAPLSHQSTYSTDQLLACLINLAPRISNQGNSILSSALVLHALISYQPEGLRINGNTATVLAEVVAQWFVLLMGALNHSALMGDTDESGGMVYAVTCQLGLDVLRLSKLLREDKKSKDFIQSILVDEQEVTALVHSAIELMKSVHKVIAELVIFTKENQIQLPTEEYGIFLKFLLSFLSDQTKDDLADICEMLFTNSYLKMLPQVHIIRKDITVRKVSTLILGEILKVLAQKHLDIQDDTDLNDDDDDEKCTKDIHMGLVELQYGIERPQTLGIQLRQSQTYSLLIYYYFYCQSSENPQEATAPLLPYLIEHILQLPRAFKLPKYIIKALWLVFAMSTISNGTLQSLDERINLEKATDRFVRMLRHNPCIFYTHNPAILLWAFTSSRITSSVRVHVLSKWLETEDSLPTDLGSQPVVWELLLQILSESKEKLILFNAGNSINLCIKDGEESMKQEFASYLWSMLPGILSKVLIDYEYQTETNICHLLELATTLIPAKMDEMLCVKVAVLISTIFSKNNSEDASDDRRYYEYVCMKLSLYLLGFSFSQNDNRVLTTFVHRPGFLLRVLTATTSVEDRVACAAMQLLSYIVHYFTKSNYQPKAILEVQTSLILKSLREDSSNERGSSLLQLVYMILNSGACTPLVLSYDLPEVPTLSEQYVALRALMFRVQMLCCKESASQSSAGWKTLSAIFKHAIVTKNDTKLVAKLTTQPWTHTLIHFQLTQNLTAELLTFVHNWITLLRITIKKTQEGRKNQVNIFQQSLIAKTMVLLKKNVILSENDEFKTAKEGVLAAVKDILDESGFRSSKFC